MALVVATLKDGLLDMATNFATTPLQAAQRFAATYKDYAREAISCSGGGPVSLDAAEAVLVPTLASIFVSGTDRGQSAAALGTAFTAFWLTPPVAFGTAGPAAPGAVTAVGGTPQLVNALNSFDPIDDADAGATRFAQALDTFTKTVVVTHPIPSNPPCITTIV